MKATFTRTLLAAIGTVGLAFSTATAAPVGAGALATIDHARTSQIEQVQYYYYGPPRRYAAPGYYHNRGYYYRRGYRGDGLAAGVAAGAIGALALGGLAVSGAFDPPQPARMAPARRQWCADRYRSYNPADGTFVGRDGRVRFCG